MTGGMVQYRWPGGRWTPVGRRHRYADDPSATEYRLAPRLDDEQVAWLEKWFGASVDAIRHGATAFEIIEGWQRFRLEAAGKAVEEAAVRQERLDDVMEGLR